MTGMTGKILLRSVIETDLPIFFEHQQDPAAVHMAAFTAKDPSDRDAFMSHWAKIFGDETIVKKTILFEGHVIGHILNFEQFGEPGVTYWIDQAYWGRGIATKALAAFLADFKVRPLFARAVKDNPSDPSDPRSINPQITQMTQIKSATDCEAYG